MHGNIHIGSAYESFKKLEEHSRGITLFTGYSIGLGGIIAFTIQTRDTIKLNKEMAKKDIEIAKKDNELRALKNSLLYGQSEEYRTMRQSYASRKMDEASTDKTE
mmetsp:Transcript_6364/g.9604  ORF Transcript_6364/g.9604 Transcript_6364/m.9604 type:complete len:105 (-) Transcript_6364:255-569(-)